LFIIIIYATLNFLITRSCYKFFVFLFVFVNIILNLLKEEYILRVI